ncbi:MAG: DUF4893 domain-containing protein [Caulobacter sp.]|nr:DUF4893 domain-containing protein [Caulobacter sp.]
MMRTPLLSSVALLAVLATAACSRSGEPARSEPPEARPAGTGAALPSAAAAADAAKGPVSQSSVESPVESQSPAEPPPQPLPPPPGEQGGVDQWRLVASPADEDRLSRLNRAWRQALREANHDHGAEIDALGLLLVPDAALSGRLQPPPGDYRCRTVKVGSMSGDGLSYVAYPWFKCTIELSPGGDLALTKTTGSQRTRGLLYPDPDNDRRLIYIGAQAWGDGEKGFPVYSQMPERDQIGAFERIGQTRWRLVLPWPKQESKLDVMELAK